VQMTDKNRHIKRVFGGLGIALFTLAATAQWAATDVPAFHKVPPRGTLPKILEEQQRTGIYFSRPYQLAAYEMAEAVPDLLYQMPCYCRCDRAMGHKSLHSCFESSHGAVCTTCMSEAAYVYQQKQAGKTTQQIRAGIERGDWQEIDLTGLTPTHVGSNTP
jgi:hypothetical protein